MGNPTCTILFDGYVYKVLLPDEYIPVAISRCNIDFAEEK
jgi:hypothetical protein